MISKYVYIFLVHVFLIFLVILCWGALLSCMYMYGVVFSMVHVKIKYYGCLPLIFFIWILETCIIVFMAFKSPVHWNLIINNYWMRLSMISCITTSRRFKCVPQILGSSSIHIFRLLFLPLSITFRRIHERNSFDLGAICLFCFEFCCFIDFLIPIVTWWVLNLSIKILGLAC